MMPTPPEQQPADTGTATAESERALRAAVELKLGGTAEPRPAPPVIPDHTLLRRIGRGAYGEVWLARSALGTLRAVKIVHRADFEDEHPYEREFRGILKYEPVSRTHEGLVQVLHVGRNDDAGCFYYVMELADSVSSSEFRVPGSAVGDQLETRNSKPETYLPRTIRSELKLRQHLAPADAAQLTLRLAAALAHLHAQGLVHRDIKPGNVIFVNGQPKLADIGLVAGAGDSRSFVGTDGFIPPEGPGTAQADIYSLGKLLYELATGRDRMDFPQLPPLGAPGCEPRAARRVDELRSQRERSHQGDDEALLELNEVMTRACAPDLQQRYASATEMQAELNLFLAGRSLRHSRNVERNLARLKKFAAATCLFLALAAVALWFSKREERHARERAHTETALRLRAEAAEHESQQQLYTALLEQSRATVRGGTIGQRVRSLDAVRRAAAISNTLELRREAVAALALPDVRFEREWFGGSAVTAVSFDSNFQRLSVSRGTNAVEIRAASDFRVLATLPASRDGESFRTTWSADDRYLAVRRDHDADGERADVEVWEAAATNRVLLLRDVPRGTFGFHPIPARLVTATRDGPIIVRDLEGGKDLASFVINGVPDALEFSPDGKRLAASYSSGGSWMISIHDAESGDVRASARFANRIPNLAWHPNGQWLAVPDYNGTVHLVDARTGAFSVLGRHKAAAYTVVFSPDGRFLISGGWDRELICWDVFTRQRSFTLPVESWQLRFRADGRQCAVVRNGQVQFFAFEAPTSHRELGAVLGAQVNHAAFSPDGRWLAASGDQRLGLWNLTNESSPAFAGDAADARPFFTTDSTELFGSSREDACFRWRIATGDDAPVRLERMPLSKPAGYTALCLASNRVVWTRREGSCVLALDEVPNDDDWMHTLSGVSQASPRGEWLAIFRPFTPSLRVYRLPELVEAAQFKALANISAASFSSSGKEVSTVARNTAEFWDIASGQRTRVVSNCSHVVFAPDDRHAWMRLNRVAGLYHLDTLQPVLQLPGDTAPLALSPDGRHLAVSVEGRRLQVWNLADVHRQLQELGLAVKPAPQ